MKNLRFTGRRIVAWSIPPPRVILQVTPISLHLLQINVTAVRMLLVLPSLFVVNGILFVGCML